MFISEFMFILCFNNEMSFDKTSFLTVLSPMSRSNGNPYNVLKVSQDIPS